MKQNLPVKCPSCSSILAVSQLSCGVCETLVSGNYSLPIILQLTEDEQNFILQFIRASGSLKEMAVMMEKSYPTVRNKLDDIIEKLKMYEPKKEKR